ncbi:uncharacterized protein LOC116006563 [Ipomoea triloba]|uniref:uncharacterized protein LOC116006563 n=1 Tax=Ipomoea triloba TaxID=35885 RepID=UPI00125D5AEA|nr:uncharacterized protein LOC116006563 [Ipomoea triloba]
MAACSYSTLSWCTVSIPKSSSTSPPSLSLYPVNARGLTGISLSSSTRLQAKFEKFQGQENLEQDFTDPSSLDSQSQPSPEEEEAEEEDDSCLPNDLEGAVQQSGQAGATFVSSGGMRAIVELLIPQLQFLDDEGAQAELWELSRIFLNTLIEETGCQRVKAIFPDAGAAALLKYQWKDAAFGFSSLGDRKPVENEDEIIVMVVPDYQMLEYVERIASNLSDDPPRPLIMWNPRLVSEDVGVGINVRRLRRNFLSTFSVVYSMRPFPSGAVFRCYPGLWKVFYDDKDRLGRYLLAKEQISRPTTEELEIIFGEVDEKQEKGISLFDQAAGIFSSINRFMKVISR